MPDKLQRNKGSILIEALVALSIIVVAFSAALSLLTSSFGLNRVISDQYTGTHLAAEGIEVVKNIIDGNILRCLPWNSGFANGVFIADYNDTALSASMGSEVLRFNPLIGVYSYDGGINTKFSRQIQINLSGSNRIQVRSTTNWTTRGGFTSSVRVEDYFYNWRTDVNIPPQCR
ncbi:hypothetical protein A3A20_00445 [Candidatus Wolfebacteria bacterium RIFCSPLOWO2_01_FULL_45_19]|uniref:Type 4 fimbrial biogenesis protein PilX N-terminal domain-containing protein n=1 Tax=Candidatus Wolfebacteria bacterium RIFCSPLOWO2_01_FULL_45_19 TaxID=1802557 RepID=A0A1F8DR07_9BACT|nr:MAG: hypothetical protein UX23_C0013G0008 [Parcubacteria group bacterium GW2011_GWB1_45_9]OGM91051.1 MAG: hypothetical protein A3A20_00445 [Candidatus Wolfebacteria bacterium RIFCSPLOWO2_01_FULL_45_19]